MSGLDKFFDKKVPPPHPKVVFWQQALKKKKDKIERLRVTFLREKDGLVYGPAKLYVHFHDAAMEDVQPPDEVDWDERLNAELVKLRANALSLENEAERFGMVFNDRMHRVENRFGDTFFNAVLVTYLKQSAFAKLEPTAEILDELKSYSPSSGQQQIDCEDMLEEVIGYCIDSLTGPLSYSKSTTTNILSESLAYFLDERFSVSDRKALGFK